MSSIAIAGGTGLVGRYFVGNYCKEYDTVKILTRGEKESSKKFEFLSTDYTYNQLMEQLAGIDRLVILAGQRGTSQEVSFYFPSIELCDTLYRVASDLKMKTVIFASSISVYNDNKELPWTELSQVQPSGMYGIYKLTCEDIGNLYSRKSNLHVCNLRLAHLYGANEKNNYMINIFMRKAFHGEALSLNTPAIAKRDFLYAKDAALAIHCAILSEKSGTYNITAGEYLTNLEVAETINHAFSNSTAIEIKDLSAKETIASSYMDGTKAREEINFVANYNMKKAMVEIHEEMRKLDNVPILF